jgi:hypothetical protein
VDVRGDDIYTFFDGPLLNSRIKTSDHASGRHHVRVYTAGTGASGFTLGEPVVVALKSETVTSAELASLGLSVTAADNLTYKPGRESDSRRHIEIVFSGDLLSESVSFVAFAVAPGREDIIDEHVGTLAASKVLSLVVHDVLRATRPWILAGLMVPPR